VWLRPGYVVLYDELTGRGVHDLELNFQFAPGVLEATGHDRSCFENRFEIVWATSVELTARIVTGGPEPEDGWIAPSLGIRRPAPRLSLSGRFSGHRTCVLTLVLDRTRASGGPEPSHVDGAPGSLPVLSVRCGDAEERIRILPEPGSPLELTIQRGDAVRTVVAGPATGGA
jgi:hypothetical protein